MKIHTTYFDMLDGRYRTAVKLGFNYVSTNKGNRYARVKLKKEYAEMNTKNRTRACDFIVP